MLLLAGMVILIKLTLMSTIKSVFLVVVSWNVAVARVLILIKPILMSTVKSGFVLLLWVVDLSIKLPDNRSVCGQDRFS